jgi:uncharacterized membrane protein
MISSASHRSILNWVIQICRGPLLCSKRFAGFGFSVALMGVMNNLMTNDDAASCHPDMFANFRQQKEECYGISGIYTSICSSSGTGSYCLQISKLNNHLMSDQAVRTHLSIFANF